MYYGNIGVLGKMLSKFLQNPCFCLGNNFFVRTPFRMFLDPIKSPLSLESIHI